MVFLIVLLPLQPVRAEWPASCLPALKALAATLRWHRS